MKKLDTFIGLVSDQFAYGGIKYGLNDKRESTDELFDAHGKNWLLGTIDKYCYRYTNLQREKDLLKIATYMYISWLKRGFFVPTEKDKGMSSPVDTNIQIKNEQFPKFVEIVKSFYEEYKSEFTLIKDRISLISSILKKWSALDNWNEITQFHLNEVFCLAFIEWHSKYSKIKKRDLDTWNEEQNESAKT